MKRFSVLLLTLLVASNAQACGPGPEMFLIPLGALAWMIVLIPLELFLLRRIAGFSNQQAIKAYLALLPAKASGLLASYALLKYQNIGAFGLIDILYSVIHGLVSIIVLKECFHLQGKPLWRTALLVSTLIPWLYRLGILVLWRIMFGPPITFGAQQPLMAIN